MSESFPIWIAFIVVLAIGLGVVRGAMLRSRGFVPRGRKLEARSAPPSPAATAPARAQVRRQQPRLGSAPVTARPGIAR